MYDVIKLTREEEPEFFDEWGIEDDEGYFERADFEAWKMDHEFEEFNDYGSAEENVLD